jgi:hypothetical protein
VLSDAHLRNHSSSLSRNQPLGRIGYIVADAVVSGVIWLIERFVASR